VQIWPQILDDIAAGRRTRFIAAIFRTPYRDDPAPRRVILPE